MEMVLIPLYIVLFAALLVSYIITAIEMAEGDSYTYKRELLFDLLPFGMFIRKFLKLYNDLED